jgi:hypothetical protein
MTSTIDNVRKVQAANKKRLLKMQRFIVKKRR